MDLYPGGPSVDVEGVRLTAEGFAGVAARAAPAPTERGSTRDGPARSVADRLTERLASVPESLFKVGAPVEVAGGSEAERGAPAAPPVATAAVDAEAGRVPLLLVEDDDGTLSWLLPDNHDGLVPAVSGERGAERNGDRAGEARFTIPMAPPGPPPAGGERGLVSLAFKKVFRVVSAALFDPLLEKAGQRMAGWAERSRQPRLRWFGPDDYTSPAVGPLGPDDLEACAAGPALLFVHGTNLLSHSAFFRLPWPFVDEMWTTYGRRVLAFDHPTLSLSPTDNARWLAAQIPEGLVLTVDVVAHGRGGLVARELAERPPRTGVRVRSVTFVGTPNAGTPLCDPAHLVSYADLMTNLLSAIPDNGITDALDGVVGVVSHLARKAYEGIPGAMAMNPGGEYLRELNRTGAPEGCTYRAIAADFEPGATSGWRRKMRDAAIDRVFGGQPNDLIVPTASVWADGLVPEDARLVLADTSAVDHTTYWEDPATLDALRRWLPGAADLPLAPPRTPAPPAAAPAPTTPITATASPVETDTRDIGSPDAAGTAATAADMPPPPPMAQLVVEVVHGSLEHAHYPLVVGHQTGAMLAGAEGYLDGRLGGALGRRQFLRLYPDALGAVLEVPPGEDPRPPGAIVVGIGAAPELTVSSLVHAATQAALARLATVADDHAAQRRRAEDRSVRIGLSSVLLGSAPPAGISVAASARAIVEGVLRANRLIQGQPATAGVHPAITHLELIELQEDRAEIAARSLLQREPVLRRLAAPGDTPGPPLVRCLPEVRRGEGGRPAARPDDPRSTTWRTVTVNRLPPPEWERPTAPDHHRDADDAITALEFRVIGDIAGVPQVVHPVDEGLLAPLLAQATRRYDPDDQVHNTLFELLLPSELKADLASGGNVLLVVDPTLASYPWEMLAARVDAGAARPLCVEGGLLRQLDLGDQRRHRLRRPSGNNALVIGNPPGGPSFASLRGASEEAVAVADLLAGRGYDVTRLIFDAQGRPVPQPDGAPDPLAGVPAERYWQVILDELYRREYRIAHLATHGTYDPTRPSRSGAVIGPDRFLSAPTFRGLRAVPDLVFFNCCHLGRVDATDVGGTDFGRVAASVATELMAGGVRAVVAAGWAVHDLDAVSFARSLYECLLDGMPYGDATRDARTSIYLGDGEATRPSPRSSTWGAYQCYGEPGFRLTLVTRPRGLAEAADLLLRSDVERRLGELTAEAGDVRSRDDRRAVRERLQGRLEEIQRHVAERTSADARWATPSLWVGLADAQRAIGDFGGAIASLDRAVHGGSSGYKVEAVEQLANLEVRQAQKLVRAGQDDTEARRLFDRAGELLRPLLDIDRTGERLALLGSYHKKRAATLYGRRSEGERQPDQEKDLVAARDAYREAAGKSNSAYHVLNDIQLSFMLGEGPQEGTLEHVDSVFRARASARGSATAEWVAYWDRIAGADRLLTDLLLDGGLVTSAAKLLHTYEEVFRERSTWRERDSTIDHLWDLAQLHSGPAEADSLTRLWSQLRTSWQGDQ